MNKLDTVYDIFNSKHQYVSLQNEKDKVIVYEKGDLLFVFNFHPTKSFEHYRIGTKWFTPHRIVMDSDERIYGGYERLNYGHSNSFPIKNEIWNNRPNYIQLYIPSRTAIVLVAEENLRKNFVDDNICNNIDQDIIIDTEVKDSNAETIDINNISNKN